MSYSTWLNAVIIYCGNEYDYMAEWYSFRTAYEEGKSPADAVRDCRDWLYDGRKWATPARLTVRAQ